jgi:hypothetical protein
MKPIIIVCVVSFVAFVSHASSKMQPNSTSTTSKKPVSEECKKAIVENVAHSTALLLGSAVCVKTLNPVVCLGIGPIAAFTATSAKTVSEKCAINKSQSVIKK